MGGVARFISFVFSALITICILYFLAAFLDILPEDYKPSVLFEPQYKAMNTALLHDSTSDSATANISKHIYDYLNPPEETSTVNSIPSANSNPTTPTYNSNPGSSINGGQNMAPSTSNTNTGTQNSSNSNNQAPQQQNSDSTNPMQKAKDAVQNYQNQINNEKKSLDNI